MVGGHGGGREAETVGGARAAKSWRVEGGAPFFKKLKFSKLKAETRRTRRQRRILPAKHAKGREKAEAGWRLPVKSLRG